MKRGRPRTCVTPSLSFFPFTMLSNLLLLTPIVRRREQRGLRNVTFRSQLTSEGERRQDRRIVRAASKIHVCILFSVLVWFILDPHHSYPAGFKRFLPCLLYIFCNIQPLFTVLRRWAYTITSNLYETPWSTSDSKLNLSFGLRTYVGSHDRLLEGPMHTI